MLDYSAMTSSQIRLLFQSSDTDFAFRELSKLVEKGTKDAILMMWSCLDCVNDYNGLPNGSRSSLENSVVAEILKLMLNKPNVVTVLCQSIRSMTMDVHYLESLSSVFRLSTSERIIVGLALAQCEDTVVRLHGKNFSIEHLEKLCTGPIYLTEQIENIIMLLNQSESLSKHLRKISQTTCCLTIRPLSQSG